MAEKTGWKRWRLAAGIGGMACMPAVSYVLFEWVTGNLATVTPTCAAVNILLMAALYGGIFAVTGRSRAAVPAASLLLYALSLGETFVMEFRGRPIMPADFLAVRTAMTVAGSYVYTVSREMILSGLCLLALNAGLFFCPVRLPWWKVHLGVAAGTAAAGMGGFQWLIQGPVASGRFGIDMWDMNSSYETEGYLLFTVIAGTYLMKDKPEGYSEERLETLCRKWESDPTPAEGKDSAPAEGISAAAAGETEPVNIICIMNESFSDLRTAGEFETNEEVLPFFDSLRETAITGNLYMPVFGAGTSNSEFEFLTGDAMALMAPGTTAYQFNVREGEGTLVSTLKEQGYEAVALHPYPGENWNRDVCYEDMDFDEFLEWEYFEDCPLTRCYVGDQANYEKMLRLLEEKENPEDRLFLFNVTMQNHGGYDVLYDNYSQEIRLTGELEGKYPMADQYLSLMRTSDQALAWLLGRLEELEEPTMVVLFGDHQPSVEDEFYYEISGLDEKTVTSEESLIWYRTPYLIWTNYGLEKEELGDMSAYYLSGEVLRLAGLETTPYQNFLLEMRKLLPVVHGRGCLDGEGVYRTFEEVREDEILGNWLSDYDCLVYSHSYSRSPLQELFHLPGEQNSGTG